MMRRVIVVLPSAMMVRNWLNTPLAGKLGHAHDLDVTVVTPDPRDRVAAEDVGLAWRELARPRNSGSIARLRFMAGYLLHLALVNRFNVIAQFRGARERLKQSRSHRRLALRDGMPASQLFGWPAPRSRSIYRFLHSLYWKAWQRNSAVEALFDAQRPDVLVLGHIQTHFVTPYALAAQARGVPVLGLVGSWDQPTTKGPLVPFVSRYLVQGQGIANELARYHGVARDNIARVGWVQFDRYSLPGFVPAREQVLKDLGLASGMRYLLFGAYPERLGRHEPDLCRRISDMLKQLPDCVLVVRCHPLDREWEARFGALASPRIVVLPPELEGLDRLAGQVRHAEMVLSSAGTILLDAVVLDTPAIGIALEDETEPYYDRVARRYDMEHWAFLIGSGGIPLARTDSELEQLILQTRADRARDAEGRHRLIESHLAPLDGKASDRIVDAIVRMASETADGQARAGAT